MLFFFFPPGKAWALQLLNGPSAKLFACLLFVSSELAEYLYQCYQQPLQELLPNAVKYNPASYLVRMLLSVCLTRVRKCIFATLRSGVSNFLNLGNSWNQFSWKVCGPWRQRLFMRSASEWGGIWEVRKMVFSHSNGHGGGYHREKLSSFSHKLHSLES